MSFHISQERPMPKLWLAKPDKTVIQRLNGIENLQGTFNYMNQNQITFDVNSHVFDEIAQEQKKNPAIHKVKNKYLIKFVYNGQEDWFVINSKSEQAQEKDYVSITADFIGKELDTKRIGDIEEIGITIESLFNKFLPVVALNWSVRHIDPKLANVKREYNLSDASVSSLIEAVCEQTDAVVVFHNFDRQLSFIHRDNAGKFKGLKVKESTYLKSFTDTQNSADLVTRLYLIGKDGLTINGINPAGTSYIEDFSYFMKPFERDSDRKVIRHSDYMSDALCHALLDYQEYFSNRQGDYEKLSEDYENLLKEQLEEDFKLSEISATLSNLEERIEVLKPRGGYTEKIVRNNTSFNMMYNTYYMMTVQNRGSLARITVEGKDYMVNPNEYAYVKIKTPSQVDVGEATLNYSVNVLASNPNLVIGLSTSSEEDFREEDVKELDKKYNVYKYRELYAAQYAIVTAVEKRVELYNQNRKNINDSLSVQSFFTPELLAERENFINDGVWREENHTDAKELLEDGRKQLAEKNNVVRTTQVDIIDFVQSLEEEDQKNWDKLVAGDKIRFSNDTYDSDLEAFISELSINFDENDVTLTLSDVIDLSDKSKGVANQLAGFMSTANQVSKQKTQIDENAGKTNEVMALLNAEWDANKRRILAGNETVDIGSQGIKITSPTHPNEMLMAVAGVIAISDDYGETFKQAINTRGVVAERLIGKVILGTELVMENNSGTMRFDDEGVRINASNFHLIADDGENYFDNLLKSIEQEFVTYEEKIKEDIKYQKESFENELADVSEGLTKYTNNLLDALADGVLSAREIDMLKMQMHMLEADYAQVRRRIVPLIQSTDVDPVILEELYVIFNSFENDYNALVGFINELEKPQEVSEQTINKMKELLQRFKPAIEELIGLAEFSLEDIQRNQIANAEYNSRTFAENLMADLEDEITDLNEALEGFDLSFKGALADGVLDMIERSQISDALMRMESEKTDVDNRYVYLSVHENMKDTDQLTTLQNAKRDYDTSFNALINRINYILARDKVTPEMIEDYKTAYAEFTTAMVTYSAIYEESLEYVQNRYADTKAGEAQKYADGLKLEVDADIKDVSDNVEAFAEDVYGAFKDGIITEQERNRLDIHRKMLEKEKSDVIERYNTIITSRYLQGFFDTETLVQVRALYGEVHADLLLQIELAMMDDEITKEEADTAVRLFEEYVERLTDFSVQLELAIAAIGHSKAVWQTEEELKNYISISVFNDEIAQMQATLDGHIMTWYYDHEPTLNNIPAKEWTTTEEKNSHIGDLFYHETEGFAYRFMKVGSTFKWELIKDTEVTKALQDAQHALDLADDKRRVFVATPKAPYDIGDLWIMGDGELMRARTARTESESYAENDWIKATKYTDDTKANAVENQLNIFQKNVSAELEDLADTYEAFKKTIEGAFKDGIIEDYELKILLSQAQSLDREKADVDALYNQLLNRADLISSERSTLVSKYNSFSSTHQSLVSGIRLAIEDGKISDEELDTVTRALENYPQALQDIREYLHKLINDVITRVSSTAGDALEGVQRFDTWKSSSFEVDSEKIATRVGESSWEEKWQPVVEQGINDAVDGIEVGGRNYIKDSRVIPMTAADSGARDNTDHISTDDYVEIKANKDFQSYWYRYYILTTNNRITDESIFVYDSDYQTLGIDILTESDNFEMYINQRQTDHSNSYSSDAISLPNTNGKWQRIFITLPLRKDGLQRSVFYVFVRGGSASKPNAFSTNDYIRLKNSKLEKGNKGTDWTEAPEDTEARMAQTNKELEDVKDSLSTFENTIITSFKDGIIETAEAKAINSHKAQLSKEKKDIDQKYTTIYANTRLAGTAKTNLLAAKTAFNTSHSSLISAIDKAIADGKATTAEYNTVISGFGDYEAKLATLTYRFEEANDYIGSAKATSAETNAKTHADAAAKNAKEAAEAYAKTKAEAERVLAEAHADGKVTAEEKARIADVNAKLKEAKDHADATSKDAEDAAKAYADTEISKIEVGGRNLIIGSGESISSNAYLVGVYELSEPWETDQEYTVVIKGEVNEGQVFGIWAAGTGTQATTLKYDSEKDVHISTFSLKSIRVQRENEFRIYNVSSQGAESANVEWVTMVKGNKATGWSPAPEDIENQFKTINSNAYGLNEDLTKAFKDGIISEAEATAIGDSINLVKSDYENVMKRYTNVYSNTGLTGTAKTNLLSARNAYNTSYNSLVNHITTVISSGKITSAQRATYNTRFSDYRVKIGDLSDAIESAWNAIVNKKSGDAADSAVTNFYNTEIKAKYSTTTQTKELLGSYVTDTEMQGNLDKIATGYAEYDVSQTEWKSLKETNGSSFNDGFSYEVTVRRKTNDDTLFVGVFNSRGKGKGWDREILERKGSTSWHPEVYNTSSGDIRLRTYGSGSTKYAMEVIYTKYAGSFTNLSKTSSMIEQRADEIELGVNSKIDNLRVGGQNLIPESDFTKVDSFNDSNWLSYGSDTSIRNLKQYDEMILALTSNPRTNTTTINGVQTPILNTEVVDGQEYTLTFYANGLNTNNFNYCYLLNTDGNPRSDVSDSTANQGLDTAIPTGDSIKRASHTWTWTRYKITFTARFTGRARILIGHRMPSDKYSYFYMTQPQLVTGSVVTDYSPSQDDNYERWSQLKITADNISSEVGKKVGNDEIISKINQSAEKVSINANKIDLIGDVSIKNGKTEISNAAIKTAHIDSLSFDVLKGGTALFGGNGDNGTLEVRDADDNSTFKMDSSQTAASHITIGELNAERINSPELVKYSDEDMIFYVRGSTYGDDSNDGLTVGTAFATFGRAIQEIPQIYDGVCEIRTRTVREYEEVEIKGFSGKGKVIFTGMTSTGAPSTAQLDTYAKFRILGNTIDVSLEKMHLYSDSGAVVQVDGASVSLRDINMTGHSSSHGLALSRNAFADWRDGEIFNVDRGVTVYYGSRAYLRNLTGRASGYGLVVAYAAMADISNFGVTGDSSNSSVWAGSHMGGSTSYPSAPKPKPAPTPKPVRRVRTFKSSSTGHYYVGASWGWNNTYMTTYPFQGKWGSVHMKEGAWFFGSTMRNTLQGKTIKKIRVSIGRTAYGSQGYTGRRKFTLRMHSHASKPSGRPNMSSGTYTGTLSLGERRWFDVTSAFSTHIQNGSWYGFGVKTTSTSDYEYMAMMKSMTVEVTYEE